MWAHLRELAACIALQLLVINPAVISREEFFIMRASFFLSWHIHRDTKFDFKQYITDSMVRD